MEMIMDELMMFHKPSTIKQAILYFDGYLTESEKCERQYYGRFWDIVQTIDYIYLYILLDDETAVCVSFSQKDGSLDETIIQGVTNMTMSLPHSLGGRL